MTGEHREAVPRLREFTFERRQQRARARGFRLLRDESQPSDRAQVVLTLYQRQLFVLRCDDLLGRLNLRANCRFADCSCHYVGRQREMRAFELEALIVDQRLQGLELTTIAAESIERIVNVYRRIVETEHARAWQSGRRERCLLAARPDLSVDLREE